jgi:hypothetical protein
MVLLLISKVKVVNKAGMVDMLLLQAHLLQVNTLLEAIGFLIIRAVNSILHLWELRVSRMTSTSSSFNDGCLFVF